MQEIPLACHPACRAEAVRAVKGLVERSARELRVVYRIEGEIGALRIPAPRPAGVGERLWEHTCMELFVRRGGPGYEEFNFSPSGEWAAYAFARYREGRPFDPRPPRIATRRGASVLEVDATIDAPAGLLALGLSAVIEDSAGRLSYWALRHAPGKPDFHRPEAFALEVA